MENQKAASPDVSNISTQVAISPSICIVDSQSHTDLSMVYAEAEEIFNQLESYKDLELIDIDDIKLTEEPFANQLIKEKFICPICRGLLVRTRILPCGHHFCRECLYCWLKVRPNCPMCRQKATNIVPAVYIDDFLDELINRGKNPFLKRQRYQRKRETESMALDSDSRNESSSLLVPSSEGYAQTTSFYVAGEPYVDNSYQVSAGTQVNAWTQAT